MDQADTSSIITNENEDDLSARFSAQLAHVREMFRVACDEFESIGRKMSALKTELDRLAQLGTGLALKTTATAELFSPQRPGQQQQQPSSPILTTSKSTTNSSQATTQTTLDDIFPFKSTNTSFNQLVNNTEVNTLEKQPQEKSSCSQTSAIVHDVMSDLVDEVTSSKHGLSHEQEAAESESAPQTETHHTGVIEESIMMQEEDEEEPKEATVIPTSHLEPAGVSFSTESDKENQIPRLRMTTSSASKQHESSGFKEDQSPVVTVEAIKFDDMAAVSNGHDDSNDPIESAPQDVKKSIVKTVNPQQVYFHPKYLLLQFLIKRFYPKFKGRRATGIFRETIAVNYGFYGRVIEFRRRRR